MLAFISPPEILLIVLLIAVLIAAKYMYNKLQEGRFVYQESKDQSDTDTK